MAVLGVGNLLLKDEGVGVHVVRRLMAMPALDDIDIFDLGTCPDAFYMAEQADKIVVVDAVRGGGEPGAVYRFTPDDIEPEEAGYALSLHDRNLVRSLRGIGAPGQRTPDVVIIGVEPGDIGWGLELTSAVEEKLDTIIQFVLKEIDPRAGAALAPGEKERKNAGL